MELKVFSPSSTVTFSKCPRRWALEKAGFKSRLIEYPEIAAILGDGFAVSMENYNNALMTGDDKPISEVLESGLTAMDFRLKGELIAGRRIASEKDQEKADKLPAMLEKAVNLILKDKSLEGAKILQVEQSYPEHGDARLDLVADRGDGPEIFDYKVKWELKDQWEAKTLEQYARSWQRSHYVWMTGIKKFNIILVVLGPKPYVKVEPYLPGEYDEAVWYYDATHLWKGMDYLQSSNLPAGNYPGSATHNDEYGACPYQAACLDYALDPQRMAVKYVQVERRK